MKKTAGFTLIEALVSVLILSVVAASASSIAVFLHKSAQESLVRSSLQSLSESLLSTVSNQDAWDVTRQKNPNMACIMTYPASCHPNTESPVSVYNSEGKPITDILNPNRGFKMDGSSCTGFLEEDSDCVFRAQVQWYVQCGSLESCKYPEELVSVTFAYNGDAILNVNKYDIHKKSRLNLSENNSPMSSCIAHNKIFVGFNQSVRNGDNQQIFADANGCVPLSAFRGASGPPGTPGEIGPAGPIGNPGPNGNVIVINNPAPPAAPTPPAPSPVTLPSFSAAPPPTVMPPPQAGNTPPTPEPLPVVIEPPAPTPEPPLTGDVTGTPNPPETLPPPEVAPPEVTPPEVTPPEPLPPVVPPAPEPPPVVVEPPVPVVVPPIFVVPDPVPAPVPIPSVPAPAPCKDWFMDCSAPPTRPASPCNNQMENGVWHSECAGLGDGGDGGVGGGDGD